MQKHNVKQIEHLRNRWRKNYLGQLCKQVLYSDRNVRAKIQTPDTQFSLVSTTKRRIFPCIDKVEFFVHRIYFHLEPLVTT